MSLTISLKKYSQSPLTLAEQGLLSRLIEIAAAIPDGIVRMSESELADKFEDCNRLQIHRVTKKLVAKGFVTVIEPTKRGSDGWLSPKGIRPYSNMGHELGIGRT